MRYILTYYRNLLVFCLREFINRKDNPLLQGGIYADKRPFLSLVLWHLLGWCIAVLVVEAVVLSMERDIQFIVFKMGIDASILYYYYALSVLIVASLYIFSADIPFRKYNRLLSELLVTGVTVDSIVFSIAYTRCKKYVIIALPLIIMHVILSLNDNYCSYKPWSMQLMCVVAVTIATNVFLLGVGVSTICRLSNYKMIYNTTMIVLSAVFVIFMMSIYGNPLWDTSRDYLQETYWGMGTIFALAVFWSTRALKTMDRLRVTLAQEDRL